MDPASPLPFERRPSSIAMPNEAAILHVRRTLERAWTAWTSTDASVRALIARAQERYRGKPMPFDPEVEAIAALGLESETDPYDEGLAAFVDLWVAEAGIAGALETLVAMASLDRVWDAIERVAPTDAYSLAVRPCRWRRLREHVAASSDPAYEQARGKAEALRASAPLALRRAIAFAFFPEPAWVEADLSKPVKDNLTALTLLGTADVAAALAMVRRADGNDLGEAAYDGRFATLLARFGDEAVFVIQEAIDKPDFVGAPWMAQILVRRVSEPVAIALASMLGRDVMESLRPWVGANPRLSIAPLADAMTRSRNGKKAGAPLLASAIAAELDFARTIVPKSKPPMKKLLVELGAVDAFATKKDAPKLHGAVPTAWTNVHAWIDEGAPASKRDVIARDAGDDARQLVTVVRSTAHVSLPFALACSEALAKTGAFRAIAMLATSTIRAEVGAHALGVLARLQRERGLTDDDAADMLVPSYGLEHGAVLDYGPRSFRVTLDGSFRLHLADGDRALKTLPKPNKKDDPKKAAAAIEAWSALRDSAPHEAKEQARRMERAMIAERLYPASLLAETIVPHPILGALARRLVWTSAGRCFRVAEDGSFADVSDAAIATPTEPSRIVHPLSLELRELASWGDLFASYEILQPFEQLARARHEDFDPGSYADRRATRAAPFVLESLGWHVDSAYGPVVDLTREIRGSNATIEIVGEPDDRVVRGVWVGACDPIAASELRREIEKIMLS